MRYILDVRADEDTGECYLRLPEEVLTKSGFKVGDSIKWVDNDDGSWSIVKMEETLNYYVVDVLSSFRNRFVVKAKSLQDAHYEVALRENDSEFTEFSQKHLGTNIIDGFEVSHNDLIKMNKQDNDYLSSWSDEQVIRYLTNDINYGD
jgi:hypothetical protein